MDQTNGIQASANLHNKNQYEVNITRTYDPQTNTIYHIGVRKIMKKEIIIRTGRLIVLIIVSIIVRVLPVTTRLIEKM